MFNGAKKMLRLSQQLDTQEIHFVGSLTLWVIERPVVLSGQRNVTKSNLDTVSTLT
jgi:hypothetical protein